MINKDIASKYAAAAGFGVFLSIATAVSGLAVYLLSFQPVWTIAGLVITGVGILSILPMTLVRGFFRMHAEVEA
jgi:hypothetical protein